MVKPRRSKPKENPTGTKHEKTFPGYPVYPPEDDIYRMGEKTSLNPEDTSVKKTPVKKSGKRDAKDLGETETFDDLDVPGGELDDEKENAGIEDEENNYYSLGGDRHDDLDEDKAGV